MQKINKMSRMKKKENDQMNFCDRILHYQIYNWH